jgi:cytoskeletal protein RodZ
MNERPATASRSLPDLAAWRQQRGLSLEQIAETTKISLRYLRAIEENRFELLPGGVYDINYLRQYARAIEFDEDELIRHYRSRTGQAPQMASADTQAGKERLRLRGPASLLRGLI